jgi:glycolate oxidase FAD binding subunit
LRVAAARAGGHATLFRASATRNSEAAHSPRFAPPAAPLDRIHRELKRQFDPAGIFNRGRLFAEL